MYAQHADKLIGLLRGSDESIEQAFVLLDSLVDTLPEDGKKAFKRVFKGLSFEKGTFEWMEHQLEKIRRWEHQRFHEKGFFWRCVDLYLRTYPEQIDALPTVLHLKYITEIPSFLKGPNPCRAIVLDNTSKSVTGLERCTTISSVRFNMNEWQWRNLPISFALNEIRNRTEDFTIVGPGFIAKWEMNDDVCELIALKETTHPATHLRPYTEQVSLTKYPLLQFSTVRSNNLEEDLWKHKTPYHSLEFGALKLVLSGDTDASIAERVQTLIIDHSNSSTAMPSQALSCVMEGLFGRICFPTLEGILIENDNRTLEINITRHVLENLPSLQRLSVQKGETTVVWGEDTWALTHPLKALTADEFDTFHHHWEFSQEQGTLGERLCKMSVAFDWIKSNTSLLAGVTHLNIFQSDVNWPFVSTLANIQQLYVEGNQWDGDFDYHGVYFSSVDFLEPSKSLNESPKNGVQTLFDLISKTDRHIYGVKLDVLNKIRQMNDSQQVPSYLRTWLEEMGVVRISNGFAWMDADVFKYKAYTYVGEGYQDQLIQNRFNTVNLERMLAGVSNSEIRLDQINCRSLRYNSSRLPLSSFKDLSVKELWIESECDLKELALLQNLEILHITDQVKWMSELPEEIGQLTNLRELYLWNNQVLSTLPDSVSQLQNLETINISGNDFTSIPEVLLSLPNLRTICLKGCHSFEEFESIQKRIHEGTCTIHFVDAR